MICLKPTFFFRLSAKEVDELRSRPIQQAGVSSHMKLLNWNTPIRLVKVTPLLTSLQHETLLNWKSSILDWASKNCTTFMASLRATWNNCLVKELVNDIVLLRLHRINNIVLLHLHRINSDLSLIQHRPKIRFFSLKFALKQFHSFETPSRRISNFPQVPFPFSLSLSLSITFSLFISNEIILWSGNSRYSWCSSRFEWFHQLQNSDVFLASEHFRDLTLYLQKDTIVSTPFDPFQTGKLTMPLSYDSAKWRNKKTKKKKLLMWFFLANVGPYCCWSLTACFFPEV